MLGLPLKKLYCASDVGETLTNYLTNTGIVYATHKGHKIDAKPLRLELLLRMSFWHILKPSVEACFILLHVSVLACIMREKARNNSRFASAFYALYCLQSVFDIVFVLMV